MALANTKVERLWAKRANGEDAPDSAKGSTVFYNGDTLYSYGTHFRIGHISRDADGKVTHVLMNSDRYSRTTSKHQSQTRYALALEAPGVEVIYTNGL